MTLPNFLIIGAQRSGSTTIHYTLARHPQIFMSPRKEVNRFLRAEDGTLPAWISPEDARRVPRSLAEYEAYFADAGPQHRAVGEASPSYLFAAVAPRIKAALPHAKLVAILRNPVGQAVSILTRWLGRPPTLDELNDWLRSSKPGPDGALPLRLHGLYADHLASYFDLFPRRQIKILLFDQLKRNPDALFTDLQDFLGVTPMSLPHLHLNASGEARSKTLQRILEAKRIARALLPVTVLRRFSGLAHRVQSANTRPPSPKLSADVRAEMTEQFYGASIRDLEQLTGIDLSVWRDCGRESDQAPERGIEAGVLA